MTKLLQCLRDELVRRDYTAPTIRSYVQIGEAFRQHTGARLDRITPTQLRRYHLFLLQERRLAVGTVVTQICALRFFCRYVLKRRDVREDLPYPKQRLRLPVVLSPDEVQRLIAGAKNLYHRTLLLTLYGAGLRRSEACQLKVRRGLARAPARAPASGGPTRCDRLLGRLPNLAGPDWRDEIVKALAAARVAILLASADFLASDFIVNDELPPLLHRASRGGVLVLPVIVGPCRWSEHKELSRSERQPSRQAVVEHVGQ